MATAIELAMERAMVDICYTTNGRTITYVSVVTGTASIIGVPASGSDFASAGLESQTTERTFAMRVRKSDVATPRKGDKVTDTDSVNFLVEYWEQENDTEWSITMRRCDGG